MDKRTRTLNQAHARIDGMEKEVSKSRYYAAVNKRAVRKNTQIRNDTNLYYWRKLVAAFTHELSS